MAETDLNPIAYSPKNPRTKPIKFSLRHVVNLQHAAYDASMLLVDDMKQTDDKKLRAALASGLANLSKAWTTLQDTKREIRGKPKAGQRKPPAERSKARRPWEPPKPL